MEVQEELPPAPAQAQSSVPSVLCIPSMSTGQQGYREEGVSVYRDASTTEDSDMDPDDPAPTSGGPTGPKEDKEALYNRLRSNATHLVYHYEGTYYPGMVTKKKKKTVWIKAMAKCLKGKTIWRWPEKEGFHEITLDDIVTTIAVPKLMSKRGNSYDITLMHKYW